MIISQRIFDLFRQYNNRRFIFVKPGGNFGDLLIYRGAENIALQAGIEFSSVSYQDFMRSNFNQDVVVYIHGGGGFNNWWSGTPMDILDKALKNHRGVVISGPQTCSNDLIFLKERIGTCLNNVVSEKIYVFARDMVSFSILEKIIPKSVFLEIDHDTALNLTITDFQDSVKLTQGKYSLYAVRDDKESVYVAHNKLFSVWLDPVVYCRDFSHWLMMHARAKKIVTNRLHSSILGLIFGKPTILFPNNYHKNRSVWEYSLSERGVQWQDSTMLS